MPFPIDNIKELCKKNNTDIKHLEISLGFSNSTISRWENAKKLPPYDKVKSVANYFNVSVSELSNNLYPDESVSEIVLSTDELNLIRAWRAAVVANDFEVMDNTAWALRKYGMPMPEKNSAIHPNRMAKQA